LARDYLERSVRSALNIPYPTIAALSVEHSMGQLGSVLMGPPARE
jgi:hypothetical protein